MKWIKILSYNLVAVVLLFLLVDFVYTRFILPTPNYIHGPNVGDHPAFHHTLGTQVDRKEKSYRHNDFYYNRNGNKVIFKVLNNEFKID